jgi:hypothetical protein
VLHAVGQDTRVMRNLAGPGVREAILSSKEQSAAIDMLVRNEFPSVFRLNSDFELVTRGDVDFRVFFYAYWAALSFAAFLALVLLMVLRRLLFGPPTRIVVHTSRDK